MSKPTAAEVRDLFIYDSASGNLIRRNDGHKCKAGDIAGHVSKHHGYRFIKIRSLRYAAHRLVWLHMHGDWPTHEIDHINGIPTDNRIENLRDVPHQLNVQNLRTRTSSSSTGLLGVGPKDGKWRARIRVNDKPLILGTFDTKELAYAAYVDAKRALHQGCTI